MINLDEILPDRPIRVVAINGSLRPGSFTRMALEITLRGARELGANTALLDLRDYGLIFCKQSDELPDGVFHMREEVRRADGIILGTPEYHGSFSGVLKNALDLMGFKEFEGKVVGLVGVAGGAMGAAGALASLRTVGRALHAWVVPQEATIPEAWKRFRTDGTLEDPNLEERLLKVGRQVSRFAYLHVAAQANTFMSLWEVAQPNPGGDDT